MLCRVWNALFMGVRNAADFDSLEDGDGRDGNKCLPEAYGLLPGHQDFSVVSGIRAHMHTHISFSAL